MKVRVIKEYYDKYENRQFNVGDLINVDNKANSSFYHIWEKKDGKEKLYIIPKENCKEA